MPLPPQSNNPSNVPEEAGGALSPTAMVRAYLMSQGQALNGNNIRRVLEANAAQPGIIPGLINQSPPPAEDPRSSMSQAMNNNMPTPPMPPPGGPVSNHNQQVTGGSPLMPQTTAQGDGAGGAEIAAMHGPEMSNASPDLTNAAIAALIAGGGAAAYGAARNHPYFTASPPPSPPPSPSSLSHPAFVPPNATRPPITGPMGDAMIPPNQGGTATTPRPPPVAPTVITPQPMQRGMPSGMPPNANVPPTPPPPGMPPNAVAPHPREIALMQALDQLPPEARNARMLEYMNDPAARAKLLGNPGALAQVMKFAAMFATRGKVHP